MFVVLCLRYVLCFFDVLMHRPMVFPNACLAFGLFHLNCYILHMVVGIGSFSWTNRKTPNIPKKTAVVAATAKTALTERDSGQQSCSPKQQTAAGCQQKQLETANRRVLASSNLMRT